MLGCRTLRLKSQSSAGLRIAALPPDFGSRLTGSPAWDGLPQCPGYGHRVSYCCLALVFGSGFRGKPAAPGWGVGGVLLGSGFGLHPTVPGWGFGASVPVCALRLYPAIPGSVVRCGCVFLGSGFGCARPLLAGMLGCVCVFVCGLPLYPATQRSVVQCWCVSLGSGSGCALPLLAGMLRSVCVCVWAPLVPCHF